MAIVQEDAGTRLDGVRLVRSRSDAGKMIKQNETGKIYRSAVDVEGAGFTYSETDADVPDIDDPGKDGGN